MCPPPSSFLTNEHSTNAALAARRSASVSRGVSLGMPFYAACATNAEVWDVEGKRYIDFGSGIGVLNVGHRHPAVLARVRRQLEMMTHTCFMATPYEPYVEVAERLNRIAPISGEGKTLLVTTGAEANENAVKIARAFTGRSDILVFSGAFHGRTLMTLAMTGKVAPYKTGFGPLPAGVWRVPYPALHRGISGEQCLEAIDRLFVTEIEPQRFAAMVIEPVQGEGGFNVAPALFLQTLRGICDRYGILLVVDEIQSGFGRTGRWHAIEQAGVTPDLITLAKGLGGGFPLAAVVGRAEVMDAPAPGGLGGTYGGNPVCCAAACGTIDAIETGDLLSRAERIGETIMARLTALAETRSGASIKNVRGLGAMMAFDMADATTGGTPCPQLTRSLVSRCLERGLMLLTCGALGETIRLLPPLTTEDHIIEEALDILGGCLE